MTDVLISKRRIEKAIAVMEWEREQIPVDEPRSIELFGEIKALKDILAGHYTHGTDDES